MKPDKIISIDKRQSIIVMESASTDSVTSSASSDRAGKIAYKKALTKFGMVVDSDDET